MREKIAIVTKDNKLIELHNISKDDEFEVDPEEFYKYVNVMKALVHTHESSCDPSPEDIVYMSIWKIPWVICSKNCIKAYLFTTLGVLEVDVNSLIPKELYDLIMKLSQ